MFLVNLISSEMKTDIEIARSIEMRRITEIAASIGIPEENVSQYGHYMAKVPADLIDPERLQKASSYLSQLSQRQRPA